MLERELWDYTISQASVVAFHFQIVSHCLMIPEV